MYLVYCTSTHAINGIKQSKVKIFRRITVKAKLWQLVPYEHRRRRCCVVSPFPTESDSCVSCLASGICQKLSLSTTMLVVALPYFHLSLPDKQSAALSLFFQCYVFHQKSHTSKTNIFGNIMHVQCKVKVKLWLFYRRTFFLAFVRSGRSLLSFHSANFCPIPTALCATIPASSPPPDKKTKEESEKRRGNKQASSHKKSCSWATWQT